LFLQWQLYRKWTERLFKEQFIAWKSGHGDKDPSEGWYESELKFFDNYVIPLATKLQECGVFGAAGAMYLEYARANRKEIEEKGERLVHEMLERCQAEFMAELMQKRDGVPLPSALSFRISEGSSVAGCEDTAPPDLSFRISDQLGPGPGGVRATCSKVITACHCLIFPLINQLTSWSILLLTTQLTAVHVERVVHARPSLCIQATANEERAPVAVQQCCLDKWIELVGAAE